MPPIFRNERKGQRGLFRLSLMLALVLATLADPATADEFMPTEFEQRLCKTKKQLDAMEAEFDGYLRQLREGPELTDDDLRRMDALNKAMLPVQQSYDAMFFKADDSAFFMASEYDVDPVKYARFQLYQDWCRNLPAASPLTDIMGNKFGPGTLPVVSDTIYRLALYMPPDAEYAPAQVFFFSGAKEDYDFGTAQVSGRATWHTTFYEGPASEQEIKAVLWQIERGAWTPLSATKGYTGSDGHYTLHLTVRPSAAKSRLFEQDIHRPIIGGFFPKGFIPLAADPQGAAIKALVDELPPRRDFTKFSIENVTKLYAVWKDAQWIQSGKTGTPQLDQWRRNHAAGRDNINALSMLIDVATTPATAHAQVADAANTWYKRLTGAPLPGVSEMTPAEKAELQAYYQRVWDRIGLTEFVAEHGRLPEAGELQGGIQ